MQADGEPQVGTAFYMHATGMRVLCNLQTLKSRPSTGKLRLCFLLLDADSLTAGVKGRPEGGQSISPVCSWASRQVAET